MADNIITITDFMDPNLDVYARLTENQLLNRANPKEGMFIAERLCFDQRHTLCYVQAEAKNRRRGVQGCKKSCCA